MSTGTIIDLAIVGVFLIAIIVGLIKGFNKLFMGFLAEVGGLVVAGLLCVTIADKLIALPQIAGLADTFTEWFSNVEFANVPITSLEELTTLLSAGVLSFLSGKADYIWGKMQAYGVNTVAGYAGHFLLKTFACILCFIVILIIVRLVLKGLCALLQKLNKITIFKIINMVLGAGWSLLVTYVILVGIVLTGAEMVLVKFFDTSIPTIQAAISESTVLPILHNTNVLGQYISQALSIPLPDLFPVAP